jgi:two-component system sensor histidine kinase MprB
VSLRARLVLAAAAAAALAVIAVALFAYSITGHELRDQIDRTLRDRVDQLERIRARRGGGPPGQLPPPALGAAGGFAQIVDVDGTVRVSSGRGGPLPVTADARAVAARTKDPYFSDAEVNGTKLRIYTVPWTATSALQVARPLDEVDDVLGDLRWLLLGAAVAGIAVASLLALLAARATLRPVQDLTDAVEDVTATRDLSRRVDAGGDDEVARLAASFNSMLAALDDSITAQRRLVADASHELRTPLTSLRTNIEVLAREGELDPVDRERLRRDVDNELAELANLVGGVIDLARGEEPVERFSDARLDQIVGNEVEQAEFHWPGARFELDAEPVTVRGVPDRIALAVKNLLDNAGKWSPEGGLVEVSVRGTEVVVRDHGPGVAPADAAHVFDRFWRAPTAQRLPGSGLGLAIVRQVAEAHGGRAWFEPAEGGGSCFHVRFDGRGR